jgi:DnaJ-domain-containing protein 1
MSIGRRLFNLARGELNALLDRVGDRESPRDDPAVDPNEDLYRRYALGEYSDEELEAELERRLRMKRQAASPRSAPPRPSAAPPRPASAPPRPSAPPPSPKVGKEVRQAYAALELPVGADFEAVRKAYRALMRKYHPDRHATTPEKQKAATELAQKLTHAYAILEKHLRG